MGSSFTLKDFSNMKIGILREEKVPQDSRVPLAPKQCVAILSEHPGIEIFVQPSPHRCYSDVEFRQAGITLREDLSSCDVILGVKEVPIPNLIADKTYLFFSHTIKEQPYNLSLIHI